MLAGAAPKQELGAPGGLVGAPRGVPGNPGGLLESLRGTLGHLSGVLARLGSVLGMPGGLGASEHLGASWHVSGRLGNILARLGAVLWHLLMLECLEQLVRRLGGSEGVLGVLTNNRHENFPITE